MDNTAAADIVPYMSEEERNLRRHNVALILRGQDEERQRVVLEAKKRRRKEDVVDRATSALACCLHDLSDAAFVRLDGYTGEAFLREVLMEIGLHVSWPPGEDEEI